MAEHVLWIFTTGVITASLILFPAMPMYALIRVPFYLFISIIHNIFLLCARPYIGANGAQTIVPLAVIFIGWFVARLLATTYVFVYVLIGAIRPKFIKYYLFHHECISRVFFKHCGFAPCIREIFYTHMLSINNYAYMYEGTPRETHFDLTTGRRSLVLCYVKISTIFIRSFNPLNFVRFCFSNEYAISVLDYVNDDETGMNQVFALGFTAARVNVFEDEAEE